MDAVRHDRDVGLMRSVSERHAADGLFNISKCCTSGTGGSFSTRLQWASIILMKRRRESNNTLRTDRRVTNAPLGDAAPTCGMDKQSCHSQLIDTGR